MKYFDKLSSITYDGIYAVKDIFDRIQLTYITPEAIGYINLDSYTDTRLYMISNVLYGTTDYWWILAILNQKFDIIYDMPLPTELMQTIASQQPTSTLINEKFDSLLTASDTIKYFKVIKPTYMNKVVLEIIRQLEG